MNRRWGVALIAAILLTWRQRGVRSMREEPTTDRRWAMLGMLPTR